MWACFCTERNTYYRAVIFYISNTKVVSIMTYTIPLNIFKINELEKLSIKPCYLWNWLIYKLVHKGLFTATAAKLLQSRPTLCNPIGSSLPGFPVPGILQARTLEWVAISFSNAWKWKVKVKSLSRVRLATPWTAAYQAPPSMGFSRQKYWSGVPLPSSKVYLRFI